MRIRLARGFWTSRIGLVLLSTACLCLLVAATLFAITYIRYAHMIDARLSGQVFRNTSRIYTSPRQILTGQALTSTDLAGYLQRAGYAEADVEGAPGRFRVTGAVVEIRPSRDSYFARTDGLRVEFAGRTISRMVSVKTGAAMAVAEIEPELLTNLFDQSREKRRLLRFEELPRVVLDAVLSAEDKRFFEHPGFDPIRVLGAAWADVRRGSKAQGASTITMQVARSFFFTTAREWRRKAAETLVALQLEQRFTKEQIFELYSNQVYLGNRGSFAIHGFGEAAQAYFGKDIRELSLGEAAFLAGIIRAPNRYSSADRNPERALEARDRVLGRMVENGKVSAEAADAAKKAGLRLVRGSRDTGSAPYFVDMVKDHLLDRFTENELSSASHRIYTTLDAELQRAASAAVEAGMKEMDSQLARRYERWRKRGEPAPPVQVALVALDPHTGEIKALVGGRDYGQSQLNRAQARRQPGSVFKPFVYAAAFENAADGLQPVVTPATTVVDEPTTFYFGNQEYTPNNYGEQFHGIVTLREALARSLNNATVKLAEMVGYDRVVQVARQMGLDPRIQATPSVALGAYEMTPLDVAAGYTPFANGGMRAEPYFLRAVVGADGTLLEQGRPRVRQALDARVAYLVTSMLEEVINRGTAAGVRARGFTQPAAGKTGTSHDGWFAGYTSNLLAVVWVGFDDNRELGLAGASSAAPIWTEFMKRAVLLPAYMDAKPFVTPPGVTVVSIDPGTLQLATPHCRVTREEVFVTGSDPTEFCERHGGRFLGSTLSQAPPVSWISRLFGEKKPAAAAAPASGEAAAATGPAHENDPRPGAASGNGKRPAAAPGKQPAAGTADEEKKKGVLRRLFGIFGSGKKEKPKAQPGAGEGKSP